MPNLYGVAIIIFEEQIRATSAMYRFPNDPTRWISAATRRAPGAAFRPTAGDKRVPDLHSQLEALLDAVWVAEENWRFDDRLDQALKLGG